MVTCGEQTSGKNDASVSIVTGGGCSSATYLSCYEGGGGGGSGGGSSGGGGSTGGGDYAPGPCTDQTAKLPGNPVIAIANPCQYEPEVLPGSGDAFDPALPYPSEIGAEMNYDIQWDAAEEEFLSVMSAFGGQLGTDPIPESYYINGIKIDMSNAPIKGFTLTALGHARNKQWFWEQVLKQKPEMFDNVNKARI